MNTYKWYKNKIILWNKIQYKIRKYPTNFLVDQITTKQSKAKQKI